MIERAFEWKFLGKYAGIVLAALSGTALSVWLVLPKEDAGSYGAAVRSLVEADDALSGAIVAAMAAEAVVVAVAVALISVFASHKIAGPLHKLGTALDRLREGPDAGPIRYREKDQGGGTATAFNGMLDGVRDRFGAADKAFAAVEEAARASGMPGGRARMNAEIDRLGEALRGFRI